MCSHSYPGAAISPLAIASSRLPRGASGGGPKIGISENDQLKLALAEATVQLRIWQKGAGLPVSRFAVLAGIPNGPTAAGWPGCATGSR